MIISYSYRMEEGIGSQVSDLSTYLDDDYITSNRPYLSYVFVFVFFSSPSINPIQSSIIMNWSRILPSIFTENFSVRFSAFKSSIISWNRQKSETRASNLHPRIIVFRKQ